MNIQESLNFISDIKKAQKDPITPVGAAYSMQRDYFKKEGIVTIGSLLSDGRFALYAQSKTKIIPKEWWGFAVINTSGDKN